MKKRNSKPSKLNDEIREFITANQENQSIKPLWLHTAWEKVAPQYALEHTDNVVFSTRSQNTTILIYVDSSQWAAELSMQKEIFRILMSLEIKQNLEEIVFLVSQKAAYKKEFRKKEKEIPSYKEDVRSVPLSEEELKEVQRLLEKVPNEKLKESLYSAIIKDLEWKKGTDTKKRA